MTDRRMYETDEELDIHIHSLRQECVWAPGPEAVESAFTWKSCTKNSGHEHFIPLNDFTVEKLPVEYQELTDLIKATADLTVRITVSENIDRKLRGKFGTGFVSNVERAVGNETSDNSWSVTVDTAKHIVFDDYEARLAKVDFFYDGMDSNIDGTMMRIAGGKVASTCDKTDFCRLICTFDNEELGIKLSALHDRAIRLQQKAAELYRQEKQSSFAWMVSHPHCLPKHITLGEITDERELENGHFLYSYNLSTCPGSSGSKVWSLRQNRRGSMVLTSVAPHHSESKTISGRLCGFGFSPAFDPSTSNNPGAEFMLDPKLLQNNHNLKQCLTFLIDHKEIYSKEIGLSCDEFYRLCKVGRDGHVNTSILRCFCRKLNQQSKYCKTHVDYSELQNYFTCIRLPKYINMILNVGFEEDRVFIASKKKTGHHWILLHIDVRAHSVYYCDSKGFKPPEDLEVFLEKFSKAQSIRNWRIDILHFPSSPHRCTQSCKNYPLQTCNNVCGLVVMYCAALASQERQCFINMFIDRYEKTFLHYPSEYESLLRLSIISWLRKPASSIFGEVEQFCAELNVRFAAP